MCQHLHSLLQLMHSICQIRGPKWEQWCHLGKNARRLVSAGMLAGNRYGTLKGISEVNLIKGLFRGCVTVKRTYKRWWSIQGLEAEKAITTPAVEGHGERVGLPEPYENRRCGRGTAYGQRKAPLSQLSPWGKKWDHAPHILISLSFFLPWFLRSLPLTKLPQNPEAKGNHELWTTEVSHPTYRTGKRGGRCGPGGANGERWPQCFYRRMGCRSIYLVHS